MKSNRRSYNNLFVSVDQPVLKTHVDQLSVGDYVLIEDEFGEFSYGIVEKFSAKKINICISGLYFNVANGAQLKQLVENKEVVIGSILPDKRIHLGNGVLFTEDHRIKSFSVRSRHRDRRKLVEQITRSTPSDWLDFSDQELLDIVERLARLDALKLDYLHGNKTTCTTT